MYESLLRENNETLWDWITWETLGNPDSKYQKGDVLMNYGLWRADYFLLCRAGKNAYQQYAGKLKATQYAQLVTDVLALHASQRRALLGNLETERDGLTDKELAKAEALVAAHDMLVGAEVQCYLCSVAGKRALAELHRTRK